MLSRAVPPMRVMALLEPCLAANFCSAGHTNDWQRSRLPLRISLMNRRCIDMTRRLITASDQVLIATTQPSVLATHG